MKDSYVFYKDKLNKEYLAVFEQVELYAGTQGADEATLEDRLSELLDIFLTAQEAGRSVRQVTGNDLEQFCRTFCSDFGIKNRILHILDGFKTIAWLLAVFSALDILSYLMDAPENGVIDIWNITSSFAPGYVIGIVIAGIISMVVNAVLCRVMFRTKRVSMKILKAALWVDLIVGFFIILYFLDVGSVDLFELPLWLTIAVSGIYLLVYHMTRGKQIKRQKVKFSDIVRAEVRRQFPAEMEKKFEKARKRSLKRGKGELTLEAFLDKEEKDCDLTEKLKWFYYLFPLAVTAVMFFTNGDFESLFDAVFFIAIMLAVEYPIMLGFWRITKNGVAERRAWIKAKREELGLF